MFVASEPTSCDRTSKPDHWLEVLRLVREKLDHGFVSADGCERVERP
jgi:hypothetical protein